MILFYKEENRKSEKCWELPKAMHLIKGGLRFKPSACESFSRQLELIQLSKQCLCEEVEGGRRRERVWRGSVKIRGDGLCEHLFLTWGLHTHAPVSSASHFSPLPCADFAFSRGKASYLCTCHSQSRI